MDAPFWSAIEAEYISTDIGYRALAKKHKVGCKRLSRYAKENKWVEKRKQFRDKVSTKTAEKTADKVAKSLSDRLADIYKATDNMSRILESATAKEENFRKRIVKTKDITGQEDYEERTFDSFDASAIKQMTGAIKDLASAVRDVYLLNQESRRDENDKGGNTLELVMPEGCEGFDG